MTTNLGTTRRRSRDEVATELARLVERAEQRMVLLQHATHNALRSDGNEARHWLDQAAQARHLLADATAAVVVGLEALRTLYPPAHADGPRVGPMGELQCACGRLALRCPARVQLHDGYHQWVDEHGKLRDITDPGSGTFPAGQR